jgi:thiamine biosynthesis lipoprotein
VTHPAARIRAPFCYDRSELRVRAFGTNCHLVVGNHNAEGAPCLNLAQAEILRIEEKFCSYQPGSMIARLNSAAGGPESVSLDAESHSLIQYAQDLWDESNHLLDPTLETMQQLYRRGHPVANFEDALRTIRPLIGWSQVEFDQAGIRLPRAGVSVNLDACVRAYAADSVRRILLDQGVDSAWISLGRDIATIGKQPDGANWLVGVKRPKGIRSAISRHKVNNRTYSIRGDFENLIEFKGEKYGRALSPVDGLPLPGLLAVCVIADSCLTTCSAASIARVKTERAALAWLDGLGLPYLAIDRNFSCHGPLAQPD